MIDLPVYAPNRKLAPRQARAGEPLWTIRKHGRQLACELRDDGEAGVEVQVYRERELLASRGPEVRRYHPHLGLPLAFAFSHGQVQSLVTRSILSIPYTRTGGCHANHAHAADRSDHRGITWYWPRNRAEAR